MVIPYDGYRAGLWLQPMGKVWIYTASICPFGFSMNWIERTYGTAALITLGIASAAIARLIEEKYDGRDK